jgi:hypothetical protein
LDDDSGSGTSTARQTEPMTSCTSSSLVPDYAARNGSLLFSHSSRDVDTSSRPHALCGAASVGTISTVPLLKSSGILLETHVRHSLARATCRRHQSCNPSSFSFWIMKTIWHAPSQ